MTESEHTTNQVIVPKSVEGVKARLGEWIRPTERVTLNKHQIIQLFQLASHHPALSSEEEENLIKWLNEFDKANGPTERDFSVRRTAVGLKDLLQYNPHSSTLLPELRPVMEKVEPSSDLQILDRESFRDPSQIPTELQFALGYDSKKNKDITDLLKALQSGDKLAFMRVKTIPKEVHNALHFLIDSLGGAVNPVIESIRTSTPLDLHLFDPALHDQITAAQKTLDTGVRKLLQVRILTANPNDRKSKILERKINNALDNRVDIPYAVWRYTLHAVKGDVQVAIGALGLSAAVAVALSQIGLGTSHDEILEGLKVAVPVFAADIATNIGGAIPFVKEDLPPAEKIKELAKVLATKYRKAIALGLTISPTAGIAAEALHNLNNPWTTILAGLVLGSSAVIPTYITKKTSEQMYSEHSQDTEQGKDEVSTHPVQKSLMTGSIASFAATSVLGLIDALAVPGLMNNAVAITGTTEVVEPTVTGRSAIVSLRNNDKKYRALLSGYPIKLFRETVNDYFTSQSKAV